VERRGAAGVDGAGIRRPILEWRYLVVAVVEDNAAARSTEFTWMPAEDRSHAAAELDVLGVHDNAATPSRERSVTGSPPTARAVLRRAQIQSTPMPDRGPRGGTSPFAAAARLAGHGRRGGRLIGLDGDGGGPACCAVRWGCDFAESAPGSSQAAWARLGE
jgi:hypothetical protein